MIAEEALQRRDQDLVLSKCTVPVPLENTALDPKERKACWLVSSNISDDV